MTDRIRMWCLRHGESEHVTAGLVGPGPSAGLTERGRHQAIQAAATLADEPITAVYSSTARRARQTAELLAGVFGLEVSALAELVEVDVSAEVLRAWVVDQDLQQRATEGERGDEVLDRMAAAFNQIASTHLGETVALVGHVASLTLALSQLCDLGPRLWGSPLPHAQPFLLESDGQAWHCPSSPTGN